MSVFADGLYKRYGDIHALYHASLEVRRGEVFGLFGPNGAGKTTFVRVLTGLTKPDAGRVSVCGVDVIANPNAVRRHTSILVEIPILYEGMTLHGYLEFFANLSGVPSHQVSGTVARVIYLVGMQTHAMAKLKTLSMGERQRAEIARVLLKPAEVLFLDEPFNGIDIDMRKQLRHHLRFILDQGKSIFLTSHNLLEAEQIVDRFAFISQGHITALGTSRELKDKYLIPNIFISMKDPQRGEAILRNAPHYNVYRVDRDGIYLTARRKDDIPELVRILASRNLDIYEVKSMGTMEDVFTRVTTAPGEVVL